jgi:RNA polymerase-binding transcription factor DksA
VDIEHYRTLLQNENAGSGIIKRKKERRAASVATACPTRATQLRGRSARGAGAKRKIVGPLKEVRLALARIDADTFGLCENGGEHIDEKRLEAIPWTRYCSAHDAEAATGPGPRRVTL